MPPPRKVVFPLIVLSVMDAVPLLLMPPPARRLSRTPLQTPPKAATSGPARTVVRVDTRELPSHGDQDGRYAKARREMARAAGVALIGVAAALEESAVFDSGVGPMGIVMLTLAARGRRLLRSVYRLVDAGERAGAARFCASYMST